MQSITVEAGREREHKLTLTQNGETVAPGIVTQVILRVGDMCLDTEDADPNFVLSNDATYVTAKLGLVGLSPRTAPYAGWLTVFDNSAEEGLPWEMLKITVVQWPVCPVEP